MRRLILRIGAAIRYRKVARLLNDRKNFPQALKLLENVEPELPLHVRVLFYLLRGFVLSAEKKLERARESILKAYVEAPKISKVLSSEEVLYIQNYAANLGILVSNELGIDSGPFVVNYESIDLKKVSSLLKRDFPLIHHPRWREVGS